MIKVLFVACLLAAFAVAQHPADWHGSWTANNRYGGAMYSCPVGNTLYGVYSNAGFFEGTISGRTVEGNYWEGGRGYRNDYQGSFRITLSADNNEFDGFYTRVSEDGEERRWHETRLGAPFPPQPSHDQCLVPDRNANLGGGFYRENKQHATQYICRDNYAQVYGSFSEPNGYLEGWSVRNNTGFHGYRYEGNGNEGAYILRAVAENVARGFYWKGRVVHSQNIELTTEDVLYRSHEEATFEECEQFGPGFLTRLRAPTNSAVSVSAGFVTLAIALLSVLFF